MDQVIFQIESRQAGWPYGDGLWKPMIYIQPKTRREAEDRMAALSRAMPMKEFRVVEVREEDIPF